MPSGVEGSVGEVSGVAGLVDGSGVVVDGVVVFVVVSGGVFVSGVGVVLVVVEPDGVSVVVFVGFVVFDVFPEEPLKSTTGVAGTGVCNGEAVCGHTPVGAEPDVEVLACHCFASLSFGGTVL